MHVPQYLWRIFFVGLVICLRTSFCSKYNAKQLNKNEYKKTNKRNIFQDDDTKEKACAVFYEPMNHESNYKSGQTIVIRVKH